MSLESAKTRPYAGRSASDWNQERHQKLLAAGQMLFGSKGYRRTSMRDLCAEAQVSSRHFYQLFADSEALFKTLYDEIISESVQAAAVVLADQALSADQRMAAALSAYLHRVLDDRHRARIVFLECIGISEAFEVHRRAMIHRLAMLVEVERKRLVSDGDLPDEGPGYGSVAMVGATSEIVIDWLHHDCPESVAELVTHISRFFEAVVLGARVRNCSESTRR